MIFIEDVSPTFDNTTIKLPHDHQSVSGKAYCVACSAAGDRVYVGGGSGMWRSDDNGLNWHQLIRPQPAPGSFSVLHALMVNNVFAIAVSPINKDIVLVATGSDARRPDLTGIYRSADGGNTWVLVHQFIGSGSNVSVKVGSLKFSPDNPHLIFAGGGTAIAKSSDDGVTWQEIRPQSSLSGNVWHIAIAPQQAGRRKIYGVGTHIWYSRDEGQTWIQDPVNLSLGAPADHVGPSSLSLAIHPENADIIYLTYVIQPGSILQLWRGNFTNANSSTPAVWTLLPVPPSNYAGTTASGTDFIATHQASDGKLYLIVSDRRTTHISVGDPNSTDSWKRIDNGVHLDPHNICFTDNWLPSVGNSIRTQGRIFIVNDGGVCSSTDGTHTWVSGKGLTTLGSINVAILPRKGKAAGICFGNGDNDGFFSGDGGHTFTTADYVGGDSDCCFSDLRQPSRFIFFAPRESHQVFLYTTTEGNIPNGAYGTTQRKRILPPPDLHNPNPDGNPIEGWNTVSGYFHTGYRPVIQTLKNESPLPDGDFIAIRFLIDKRVLLRTTKLSSITSSSDWVTASTSDSPTTKVFQVGPDLPDATIDTVQASGGHTSPVFFVGNPASSGHLWKLNIAHTEWQLLVPRPVGGPSIARRFFVDPYRSNIIYILDQNSIRRSDDGGLTWLIDESLQHELTENNNFPFSIPNDENPGEALLRDMAFDPVDPGLRFAVGPAGIFITTNGVNWNHLIRTSAMPMRPNNLIYDYVSDACGDWILYVTTNNRGLLRIQKRYPIGSTLAAYGKITLLRVHEVGTHYGPPADQLDDEVIIQIDSEPGAAFGFQLRNDNKGHAYKGMLSLLRDAFNKTETIRIDYVRKGCDTNEIIRVMRPG